jgi:class 3 adenylate cyclase/tetratricopeptide (TPR) repeat protein
MQVQAIDVQIHDLEQAIAAQENLRGQLSDAILASTLATLQEKLEFLRKAREQTGKQRKQVTILFADVAGSTAMAETMDPEVWSEIMDEAFEHFIEPVEAHRGMVARLMGDAILAFFGAAQSHEEDPALAVLAGLAMIQGMQPLRKRVSADYGLDFRVRVGINTGEVLLGQFGTDEAWEFTAMGDAVNLASRIEHAAPSDSVLISEETLMLLGDRFETRAYQEIQFKGKSSGTQTFLVMGRREIPTPASPDHLTPFVGRENELIFMARIARRAVENQNAQVLTILGEAGVGKTRLLKAFMADPAADWFPNCIQARITPESGHNPFHTLKTLLWNHLDVLQSDPQNVVEHKLRQNLGLHLDAREMDAVRVFMGLGGAGKTDAHLLELGQGYLRRYLKSLAQAGPLLILLEDLHWADPTSVDFILSLLNEWPGEGLLVIALARPALMETHSDWMSSATSQTGFSHRVLQLSPLNAAETHKLIVKMLDQVEGIPEKLWHLILHMTNGNPFYVESLIRMFIDEGLIVCQNGRWVAYLEEMNTIHLPRTLKGVLQARLDRLSGRDRRILQQAAVVGAVFWDEVLHQLGETNQISPQEIMQSLKSQMDKGLVSEKSKPSFEGTHEYHFEHALLRDAAYESVLLKERRALHRRVAEWLLVKGAARILEYVGLVAYHYEKSQVDDLALPWLEEAARQAMQTSAYFEAAYYFNKALLITEKGGSREKYLDLLEGMSAAYDRMGRFDEAVDAAQQVNREAKELGLDGLVSRSASRLSWLTQLRGEHDLSKGWAEEALAHAQKMGDKNLIARALTNLADKYENNDLSRELELYEQALALLEETNHRLGIAVTYLNMGNVHFHQESFAEAREHYEKSLAIYSDQGNLWGMENCMGNIGMVLHRLGDLPGAAEQIRRALKIAVDISDQEGIVIMNLNLGYLSLAKSDPDGAREAWLKALNLAWQLKLVPLALDALCGLSALLARIDPERARRVMGAVLGHPAVNVEVENNAREIRAKNPEVFGGVNILEEDAAVRAVEESVRKAAEWVT